MMMGSARLANLMVDIYGTTAAEVAEAEIFLN